MQGNMKTAKLHFSAPSSCRPVPFRAVKVSVKHHNTSDGPSTPAPSPSTRRALLATLTAVPLLTVNNFARADEARPTRAFFDVVVDGKPVGRIVVEVDPSIAPLGARRFMDLAQGKEGVSYRRTRIELLQDGYLQDSGLKALSYKASGRTSVAGGPDSELLEVELSRYQTSHAAAGLVSLVVRNAEELETKDRLVAVKGKFVTVSEIVSGENPNGTAFAITLKAEPSLDATNLVVGRVVEGMQVVEELAKLPRVKDNSGSPFFMAGKASGDKRATVAERAFGKPFAKIVIESCGVL